MNLRTDLNKVLCEHERYGGMGDTYRVHRKSLVIDEEFSAGKEPMRKIYGWQRKNFSENLNPLKGLIRKNVGRKWNDFFSELNRVFDTRSVINRHILEHLYDYCEQNVLWDGKELYVNYYGRELLTSKHYTPFFVDPRDGIIKVNPGVELYKQQRRINREAQIAKQLLTERKISKNERYIKTDGTWFYEKTVDLTRSVKHVHTICGETKVYYRQEKYTDVVKRRTVGKKEKRDNNLS